jgi:hypothetical protein
MAILTKRNILIASGLAVSVTSLIILIRRKTFGKKLAGYINAKLEGRESLYGTIKDYGDVFSGDAYISKVSAKVQKDYNGKYDFWKLKDEFVTKYRKKLYDAMESGTGFGTWEADVIDVFNSLRDKVSIAQVAQSYKTAYNKNLLDTMLGEMDDDSNAMKEINDIITTKLPFRLKTK